MIAKGRHDPIVSEDEFEQAKRVMKSKARGVTHPRQAGSVWLLSGMLKCRKCEANLIIRSSKKGTSRMYKCRTRRYDGVETCDCPNVNAQKLDERFLRAVLEDILCPSNVEAAHRKMSEELTEPYGEQKARLQALEKELLDVEQRKARVMEAYESGAYSVDDYSRRTAPLTKAEAELRQTISETSERLERETALAAEPGEIMEFVAEVSEFIRNSPPKERKNMLQRFIKCVWIEAGKATAEYRIPLPRDAKRPNAKELVLALDGPVPPTARVSPLSRGQALTLSRWERELLLTDRIAALAFEIVGGAQGQRLDGGRGVDAGAGGEDAAVDDEHIGHIVAAAPAVYHRVGRVVAHARRSQ